MRSRVSGINQPVQRRLRRGPGRKRKPPGSHRGASTAEGNSGMGWARGRVSVPIRAIQRGARADDWIRTSMGLLTRQVPSYIEPRRPIQGVWGELNPPLQLSQSRVPNRYTTNPIGPDRRSGSTPTRIRTRNAASEARCDCPFHHRGNVQWTYRDSNPNLQHAELVSSPWTIGPRQWTAGDSNPNSRHATPASSRWTSSPDCQWRRWESNPSQSACKAVSPPWDMRPHEALQRSARDSNPVFLPTKEACRRQHLQTRVTPDGLEPSFPGCRPGVVAAGPRDRVRRAVRRRQATIGTGPRPVFTADR